MCVFFFFKMSSGCFLQDPFKCYEHLWFSLWLLCRLGWLKQAAEETRYAIEPSLLTIMEPMMYTGEVELPSQTVFEAQMSFSFWTGNLCFSCSVPMELIPMKALRIPPKPFMLSLMMTLTMKNLQLLSGNASPCTTSLVGQRLL